MKYRIECHEELADGTFGYVDNGYAFGEAANPEFENLEDAESVLHSLVEDVGSVVHESVRYSIGKI